MVDRLMAAMPDPWMPNDFAQHIATESQERVADSNDKLVQQAATEQSITANPYLDHAQERLDALHAAQEQERCDLNLFLEEQEHHGDSNGDSSSISGSSGTEADLEEVFSFMNHVLRKGLQYRFGIERHRCMKAMTVTFFWRWQTSLAFTGSVTFRPLTLAVRRCVTSELWLASCVTLWRVQVTHKQLYKDPQDNGDEFTEQESTLWFL